MWHDLLVAVALVLVIEGITPFMSPETMRSVMRTITAMSDRAIRIIGLISMLVGVTLLTVLNM